MDKKQKKVIKERINNRKLYQMGFKEGQQEYKQFILNILKGVDIADKKMGNKMGGTAAIRHALRSRIVKSPTLAPVQLDNQW